MEMEIETIPNDNNAVAIFNKDAQDIDNNNMSLSEDSSSYNISYNSTPKENVEEHEAIEKLVSERGINVPSNSVLLKQLGPQHLDRLYSKILRAREVDNVIHHWQNEYRENKDQAIHQLYQLYVDLSSYQHINVKTFLVTQENDINELVPYMETKYNTILSFTGKYFLLIRNKSNKMKQARIEEFISKFVAMAAKEKIIYDYNLILKLINFFVQMSNSSKRPIKHTGVFIALKHQTGIIHLGTKIVRKIDSIQKALKTEEDPELIQQMNTKIEKLKIYDYEVNKMISFLQLNIFCKNWNYLDPKLHIMRQECILELYKWIEMFPGRYLHNENIKFILEAITDANKLVRYSAIQVIAKIVENFEPVIHSKLCRIISPISKQIKDVDYNVAILAVDTITLIRRYISIPSDIREVLCKYIYNMHYPLAAACGRYLSEFLRERNGDNYDDGLLKLVFLFEKKAMKRGYVGIYPYVIEAIYDWYPILQDVNIYIKILEEGELDEELITIWVNILTESVHQTFTGKCSLQREKQRVGKVNVDQVENIIKDLIRSMKTIISYCPLEKLSSLFLLIRDNMPNHADDISA